MPKFPITLNYFSVETFDRISIICPCETKHNDVISVMEEVRDEIYKRNMNVIDEYIIISAEYPTRI